MRRHTVAFVSALVVAVITASVAGAQDVAGKDDAYDILSMAIELDLKCPALQYFEQRFLRIAANRSYDASRARQVVIAANDPSQAASDLHQGYRHRAEDIECRSAGTYLSQGRGEAYAQLGQALVTAQYLRGQATIAPGFAALTDEQRQLVGAFAQAGAQAYGTNWQAMDGYIQQVAARRMQELGEKNEAVRLVELSTDWDAAFTTIRFQAAAAASGYVPRIARLANAEEAVFMDAGSSLPRLIVAGGPQSIRVPLLSGEAAAAYSFFAVMPDGSALVAVYGEGAAALPPGVRQRLLQSVPVDGERFTDDCPFEVCFRIRGDRIAMLLSSFSGSYLESLVTEWGTDAEREFGADRMAVGISSLAAAVAEQ